MRIEEILDLQHDAHKFYSTDEGTMVIALLLFSIADRPTHGFKEIWDAMVEAQRRRIVEQFMGTAREFISHLYRGDCTFVTKDILTLATKASEDLPDDVAFSEVELLCPYGFMLFEEGILIEDEESNDIVISGFAWGLQRNLSVADASTKKLYDDADIVHIWFLTDNFDPRVRKTDVSSRIQVEHWYPLILDDPLDFDDRPGSVKPWIKLFITLQLLARQEIIEVRPQQAPRATRKRVSHWRPQEGYISLITLRHKKVVGSTGEGKVEHQYRWLVGSHWRRQWYPSLQKHQWKYIVEYVKGPEDKPLVIRSRRVYNFRR